MLFRSNAAAFRMEADVPLLMPELNPDHLRLLNLQRTGRGWKGGIVCNPNCTTTITLGALGPLHRVFGTEGALITSMQALSGAGYPGVSALDAAVNVIPYIAGEEAKVEAETQKILGTLVGDSILATDFPISAQCNRVPVVDGHTICLSLQLYGRPTVADISSALERFLPGTSALNLPSAPLRFLRLRQEQDRPQPSRDVEDDNGMTMQIGRIRSCPVMGVKMVVLGHNVERGAAGGSLLNAELAVQSGFVPGFGFDFISEGADGNGRHSQTQQEALSINLVQNSSTRSQDVTATNNGREKELTIWI